MLTFKVTILLALASAARAHELAALDLDYSLAKEESWEFTIPEHVKNSRLGHPPRKIFLPAFPQDTAICVVRTLVAMLDEQQISEIFGFSHRPARQCLQSDSLSLASSSNTLGRNPLRIYRTLNKKCLDFCSCRRRSVS